MADSVLFLGWNRPAVGREERAFNLWRDAMEFYGKLQSDGQIESFEPVILNAHGGDLNGFILIKGSRQKLDELRRDDTFMNFVTEGGLCLNDFGVITGYVGDGLADVFDRWARAINK